MRLDLLEGSRDCIHFFPVAVGQFSAVFKRLTWSRQVRVSVAFIHPSESCLPVSQNKQAAGVYESLMTHYRSLILD